MLDTHTDRHGYKDNVAGGPVGFELARRVPDRVRSLTILDTVVGVSVHTTLGKGEAYTTVDLHVQYLRAMTVETGRVTAVGEVVHRGRKIATAEGRVTDARGKLIATAITTCMIL